VALYLTRFTLSPEAWAGMIREREDRRGPVSEAAEAVGGRLVGFWYAFGEDDGYALLEAPDNTAMAAVLTTVAASGVVSVRTTVLLSVEEMLDALGRAQSVSYRPPAGLA
jgi:uncharacterized protein with GYD domain